MFRQKQHWLWDMNNKNSLVLFLIESIIFDELQKDGPDSLHDPHAMLYVLANAQNTKHAHCQLSIKFLPVFTIWSILFIMFMLMRFDSPVSTPAPRIWNICPINSLLQQYSQIQTHHILNTKQNWCRDLQMPFCLFCEQFITLAVLS